MKRTCPFCSHKLEIISPIDAFCVNGKCYVNSKEFLKDRQAEVLSKIAQQNIQHAINVLAKAGYMVIKK